MNRSAMAQTVSAQVVGNAFVQQYYHLLHHEPGLVYMFYKDISKLARPEEDGSISVTTTVQAINEKIVSLNYADFKAEIRSVDAQESFNGGVHVLVTGCLTGKDSMIRNFAQTFFLAPQDRGYFVLNDVFRYVANGAQQAPNQGSANDVVAPVTPDPNPIPVVENHISAQKGANGGPLGDSGSELPQKVLESLFSMPTPKNAEHELHTLNWKKVVEKFAFLGQKAESCPVNGGTEQHVEVIYSPYQLLELSETQLKRAQLIDRAKGDEYQVFRQASKEHWESTRSYYQKAATTSSNGERAYAACISEQARLHSRMAREADERASKNIFMARNKSIENMITIDLHGQHVKPAMKLLKIHLCFGAYVGSVRLFRIITGYGSHGVKRSKLKCSVINFLEKEGIKWSEENRGALLVTLDGQTDFSFLENDSDDE